MSDTTTVIIPAGSKVLFDKYQPRLMVYFTGMDADGLYKRFMGGCNNKASLERYLERSATSIWILQLDDEGAIAGELHLPKIESANNTYELGMSVREDMRGKGIGETMFSMAMTAVKMKQGERILITCLADNKPIQYLANKYSANITNLDIHEKEGIIKVSAEYKQEDINNIIRSNWDFIVVGWRDLIDMSRYYTGHGLLSQIGIIK